MEQEKKPRFKRSFIPKIFFAIISITLIITLKIINKAAQKQDTTLKAIFTSHDGNGNSRQANTITLYIANDCPYCSKVIDYMKQEKIDITTKNISNNEKTLQELVTLTKGKDQVPCLTINNHDYLFESSEIIQQLQNVTKGNTQLLQAQNERKTRHS